MGLSGGWSGMALVRRIYKVPAYRGRRVAFTGNGPVPVGGRIISSDGQYLWIRTDAGERFGPLHPTWEMHYGDE